MNFSNAQDILNAKEGENLEFKEAKARFDFEELVKYACAFANAGGGRIVFGVSDKRPREIVGTAAFPQPERTRRQLMDRLGLPVDFQLFEEGKKQIIVFLVPPRPAGMPVQDKGRDKGSFWWRDGDSLVPMPADVMRDIFAEGGHDFSAETCPGTTIADLDEAAVAIFRERVARNARGRDASVCPAEQFLSDCGVLSEGGVTYAGLVLFGVPNAVRRHLSQCEIVFEYRSTEASGPAQQRVEFRQGFFSFFDALWELINLRNDLQHYQDGLFMTDVPTFDERTIREAVMNAVCHRDYQLGGSVFIIQYPRTLVVRSPGGLPPGVTPENILNKHVSRNRLIAELLQRCGLVERAGQGMNLMFERSILQAKNIPRFHGTDRYQMQLTLDGLVRTPALLVMMERVGRETLRTFSTEDFLVVDNVYAEERVPKELMSRVSGLLELGVIEKAGRNRYVLSKRFYTETGRKGTYTRKKGLDREENKALLLKHIRENNAAEGTQLSELCQVLTHRSPRQVQTLLKELQNQGCIIVTGKTRAGRWHLVPEQG